MDRTHSEVGVGEWDVFRPASPDLAGVAKGDVNREQPAPLQAVDVEPQDLTLAIPRSGLDDRMIEVQSQLAPAQLGSLSGRAHTENGEPPNTQDFIAVSVSEIEEVGPAVTSKQMRTRTLDEPPSADYPPTQETLLPPPTLDECIDWLAFLESQYQRSTRESGSRIDKMMIDAIKRRGAVKRQLNLIDPLLNTFCFRLGLLLLGCLSIVFAVQSILFFSREHFPSTQFTLDVLQLRDRRAPAALGNLIDVGLIAASCEFFGNVSARGSASLQLEFPGPLAGDGWLLVTGGEDRGADPTRFTITAHGAGAEAGQALLSEVLAVDITGRALGSEEWAVEPRGEAGAVRVEVRPRRAVGFVRCAAVLVMGLGSVGVVVLASWEQQANARVAWALLLGAEGAGHLVVAVMLSAEGQGALSLQWWRGAGLYGVLGVVVAASEVRLSLLWALYAAVGLQAVLLAVEAGGMGAELRARVLLTLDCMQAALAGVLAGVLSARRRGIIEEAQRAVESIKRMLGEAWGGELAKAGEDRGRVLHEIADLVSLLSRGPQRRPQQRPRHSRQPASAHGNAQSLDQLYAQACGCQLLLRRKVKELAEACGGMFARSAERRLAGVPESLFVAWEAAKASKELQEEIEWAPLKPEARAVDKVVNHYLGDVSRITDLCRETLVVRSLADVAECLHAVVWMVWDRQVQVVRVKNYLTGPGGKDAGSDDSGGFRALVLNLRLVSRESRALGLGGHVCELLIVPHAVAACLGAGQATADPRVMEQLREAKEIGALSRGARRVVAGWVRGLPQRVQAWRSCGQSPLGGAVRRRSSLAGAPSRGSLGVEESNNSVANGSYQASGVSPRGRPRGAMAPPPLRSKTAVGWMEGENVSVASKARSRRHSWTGSTQNGSDGGASSNSKAGGGASSGDRTAGPSPEVGAQHGGAMSPLFSAKKLSDAMVRRMWGGEGGEGGGGRRRRHSEASLWSCGSSELAVVAEQPEEGERAGPPPQPMSGQSARSGRAAGGAAPGSFRSVRQLHKVGNSMRSLAASEQTRSRSNSLATKTSEVEGLEMSSAEQGKEGRSKRGGRRARGTRKAEAAGRAASGRGLSEMVRRGTSAITRFGSLVGWRAPQQGSGGDDGEENVEDGGYAGRGQGAWYDLMEHLYWERTQGLAGRLDEKKGLVSSAVSSAEQLAALKTSFPVPSAMCKTWFLLAALGLAVTFVASGAVGIARAQREAAGFMTQWVKFTVKAVRGEGGSEGGGAAGLTAAVGSVGVLHSGCQLNSSHSVTRWREEEAAGEGNGGGQWLIDLGEPRRVDGFYFETSQRDPAQDPAVFEVEVLTGEEGEEEWELLGASQRWVHLGGWVSWGADEGHPRSVARERGAEERVEARTGWWVWLSGPVPEVAFGLGWLAVFVCGVAHRRRWLGSVMRFAEGGLETWLKVGNAGLRLGALTAAGSVVVSAGAQQVLGSAGMGQLLLGWGWAGVGVGAAVLMHRHKAARLLVEGLTGIGFARLALRMLDLRVVNGRGSAWRAGEMDVVSGLVFVSGLSLLLVKWHARRVAQRDVQEDVLSYERVWAEVNAAKAAGVEQIRVQCDALRGKLIAWMPVLQEFVPDAPPPLTASRKRRLGSRFFGDGAGSERRSSATLRSQISHRNSSPHPNLNKRGSFSHLFGRGTPGRGSLTSWMGNDSRRASVASAAEEDLSFGFSRRLVRKSSAGLDELESEAAGAAGGAGAAGEAREGMRGSLKRGGELLYLDSLNDEAAARRARLESREEVEGRESNFASWPPEGGGGAGKVCSPLTVRGGLERLRGSGQERQVSPGPGGEGTPMVGPRGGGKRDSMRSRDSEGSQVFLMKRERDSVPSRGPSSPCSATDDPDGQERLQMRSRDGRGSDPGLMSGGAGAVSSPEMSPGLRARRHSTQTESESFRGLREMLRQRVPFRFFHPAAGSPTTPAAGAGGGSCHGNAVLQSSGSGRRKASRRSWSSSSQQRNSISGSLRNNFFAKRALRRQEAASVTERGDGSGSEFGTLPVESLDQLFAQAAGLSPFLKAKVQEWAKATGGMFPVLAAEGAPRFKAWERLVVEHGEERAGEMVKWPSLKKPERAIEKLVRSYGGRVSRLLDICRQSIVFEEPEHLAACLALIAADDDKGLIEVVAIKNRLQKDYDARILSLGYRDVNVNLRITTEATKKHGIHPHVCEVQLLLRAFSEYKSEAGHKRYVAFRNARGR